MRNHEGPILGCEVPEMFVHINRHIVPDCEPVFVLGKCKGGFRQKSSWFRNDWNALLVSPEKRRLM